MDASLLAALRLLGETTGVCSSNCQVCAQLALEGDVGDTSLWSQGAALYFDFDDLDDQEVQTPQADLGPACGIPGSSRPKFAEGLVVLRIVSALTGEELCTLRTARSTRVRHVKEQIEQTEGTNANTQKLLLPDGKVARDDDMLAEMLPDARPQLMLVRSQPVWAGLLERVAAGEVQLQDLDEGARSDRGLVLAAVRASQGRALEHACWALRSDKDLVLEAVKRNGLALRHAALALRGERDLVLLAIRDCPLALEHASDLLRKDRDFIEKALRISPKAAAGISEELLRDLSFALGLVGSVPSAFQHLQVLRRDRAFLLQAVKRNGEVLRYAAGWHGDPEVALTAIQKAANAVHFVDANLRQQPQFAHAAVTVNPWAFEQLGWHHRGDLQLALLAARLQPALMTFAGERIREKVMYIIKKELSEQVDAAPKGYVEGPVWWLPETFRREKGAKPRG
ncbi:unnamed protein product [Effrenium voratum]|uniref:Ubiquitin-like domain-containing protein n=1 Tax=Effrenium voratum TaxID=2562239 RepID=A0AA36HMT3_9DINO|nr:unnamed protein product [Effrenium voratum]